VPAADGIGFVMDVPGGVMGVQNQAIGVHLSEMKDSGFVMIDPYDRVVMRHSFSNFVVWLTDKQAVPPF
jgi:hypothetical protein